MDKQRHQILKDIWAPKWNANAQLPLKPVEVQWLNIVFKSLRIWDHKPHTIALDPGTLLFPGQVLNHTGPVPRTCSMQTTAALAWAMMPYVQPDRVQCPPASMQLLPWPRVASVWKCFRIIGAELPLWQVIKNHKCASKLYISSHLCPDGRWYSTVHTLLFLPLLAP